MTGLRVVIGSDEAGYQYKTAIGELLRSDPRVAAVIDLGVGEDQVRAYPSVAFEAARTVRAGEADRGVLVCGTGIGMAISANKVEGIRATTAHDSYSVERSVLSNDAQILTLGERVIGKELALRLVREWLGYTFDPASPSACKVALIDAHERDH